MTLGMPTIGKNSESIEYLHWEGNPPKDEFFWLTAINKATLVLNHRIGLISAQNAKKWARALQEVEEGICFWLSSSQNSSSFRT